MISDSIPFWSTMSAFIPRMFLYNNARGKESRNAVTKVYEDGNSIKIRETDDSDL